jgi:dTMP kinase
MYFIFEGPDGSGKTTLIEHINNRIRHKYNTITTRQPGSTELGTELRKIAKGSQYTLHPFTRQLVYMVDTVHYYDTYLEHMLDRTIILQDRSSYISSLVYGIAEKADLSSLIKMLSIYSPPKASKVFILQTDLETCFKRRMTELNPEDHFDSQPKEFHKKVSHSYQTLLTADPKIRLVMTEICHLDNFIYLPPTTDLQQLSDIVEQHIEESVEMYDKVNN